MAMCVLLGWGRIELTFPAVLKRCRGRGCETTGRMGRRLPAIHDFCHSSQAHRNLDSPTSDPTCLWLASCVVVPSSVMRSSNKMGKPHAPAAPAALCFRFSGCPCSLVSLVAVFVAPPVQDSSRAVFYVLSAAMFRACASNDGFRSTIRTQKKLPSMHMHGCNPHLP